MIGIACVLASVGDGQVTVEDTVDSGYSHERSVRNIPVGRVVVGSACVLTSACKGTFDHAALLG